MAGGFALDDVIVLRTYLDRYDMVIRTRLISVTALVFAIAASLNLAVAVQFAALHYALFGLLIWSVSHARRRVDEPGAGARLRWQTLVLAFLISLHTNVLALYVDHMAPDLHVECVLLVITLVVLTGLQAHLSVAGFLLALLPPIATFILITRPEQTGDKVPLLWGGGMFIFATLAAAWRQQASDRGSAVAAAAIARRNEELEAALASAEAANRAKTEFLAVTSHEVRTPLNAVLAMAGVLARELRGRRHRELARNIETAGSMLLQLLNGVLDFTRAEAGKAMLRLGPVDPDALVKRIEAVWRVRCDEAGLGLACDVSLDPRVAGLRADAGRIEQTLVNLVSNAVKFSPPGGEVLVRCQVRAAPPDRARVRLEVLDRGPGIAPEDRARIFEPFEQTAAGREQGGAGLGLAICRSNVELMEGRFGRDDRPGGGSVFWFEFETATVERIEAANREIESPAIGRLRILAAEDNPTNREVLKLLLEPLDAELTLAVNGADALEAAAAGYDLILMDAKMPVMDGLAATREIRAREAHLGRRTPILMVTANVFPEDVASYLAAGADGVVGKPIQVGELLQAIASLAEPPAERPAKRRRRKA